MIRTLTPDDLDAFIEIRMMGLKTHPEAFGAAFEEGIDREKTLSNFHAKNDEDFILGYFSDQVLVGLVGFIRMSRIKKRHKGFIWGMYVRPAYQGKGIGRALMEFCIQKASLIDGLQTINISVTAGMESAESLYQSLGFQTYAIEKDAMLINGVGYDEIYMSRDIL